jgi:KaiC/GvpD/RAD55 family RecA-like ATPase
MIKEKVKTGIAGLDEMLDGGLIPGRPYVVSGTSGTGKSTVAMHFLLEGVQRGEKVLYVCVDEPPNEVKANMSQYGWDLSKVYVFDGTMDIMSYDKTPVRDVSTERKVVTLKELSDSIRKTSEKGPVDMSINTLQELLKAEMRNRNYSRVVVDSITSLRRFYIKTSEEYATLASFFRVLSDLGVTTLATVHQAEIYRPDAEAHMSRGEIRLHKWFDGRGLVRGVTVEKYRGSSHDYNMRPMKITATGVEVKTEAPKESSKAAKSKESEPKPAIDKPSEGGQVALADPAAHPAVAEPPATQPMADSKLPPPPQDSCPPPSALAEPDPPPPGGGQ